MKNFIIFTCLLAATAVAFSVGAACTQVGQRVTVSPSSKCTLSFVTDKGMNARILDQERIEVSWHVGKRELRTQIRVSCEDGPLDRVLNDEGFSRAGEKWELSVGATGSSSAKAVTTPTWRGVIGTYFLGSVCRTAVGQSASETTHFSFGLCIAESEYPYAKKIFNRIEQHIVLENPQP